jgi:hypothetical protein
MERKSVACIQKMGMGMSANVKYPTASISHNGWLSWYLRSMHLTRADSKVRCWKVESQSDQILLNRFMVYRRVICSSSNSGIGFRFDPDPLLRTPKRTTTRALVSYQVRECRYPSSLASSELWIMAFGGQLMMVMFISPAFNHL